MPATSVLKPVLFVSLLSLWPASVGAAEISRAQMLANSCAGCHGPHGRSPGAIPSIAGRSAQELERAMLAFRSGERPATVMNRHAKGYSDEEIRLLAEYFAAQ